ncbi:Fc receptor-like protein 4 isoform X1 [Motacilla alba alba]|uniref:Fc receptor-like protein 4 isoform X1 n=1 Tax=Motacilla alba alba TaxID=1094192 RepID=UPI0018D51DB9|nr:Fc receptor-like protein 4 isoform X1 [Motacilla alba alba]
MAGDTGMAVKVALLLWAQTLSLSGMQTTQLLVDPPWRPAVLWDRVTLTCQGSGTVGATTWYKDGQRWGQERGNHFTVTESGTYMCDRPGSGLSPPVNVSDGEDSLCPQPGTHGNPEDSGQAQLHGSPPAVNRVCPLQTGTSQSMPVGRDPCVETGEAWCTGCVPILGSQ